MGGVNIKDENKKLDTYLKNCCVSCVSAKKMQIWIRM